MIVTNTASNLICGVIASLLLTCAAPAAAEFISRDGAVTMESSMIWAREDDGHFIDAEGPCESLENPEPDRFNGYAGYGLEISLPAENNASFFDSEELSCSFDFRDEFNGGLGSGSASAYLEYLEDWHNDVPLRSTLRGTHGVELEKIEQDEVELRPIFSESDYVLEFSIDQAGQYLLRVLVLPTEGAEFTPPTDIDAFLTLALRDSNLSGPTLSAHLDTQTGEPTRMEMLAELMPGDHSLRVESSIYFATEDFPPGNWSLSMDFVADFVWCENVGTDGDDTIVGSIEPQTFCLLGGNDEINGGGGEDIIFLGAGDDIVNNQAVYDEGIEVYGGDGDDVIFGTNGFDELYGEAGHDMILGGDDDDLIHGGEGDDQIEGNEGDDEIYGESGFDKIDGGDGDDLIWGGDKKDVIHGDGGGDFIDGEDGDDVLYGDDDDDFILGGNGRDEIYGGRGKDELFGENANDTIDGGIGGDIIEGGQGHDILRGGPNRDRIIGNGGNEILIDGGTGRDRIRSGPGNDFLDLVDGEEDFANCGAGTDDASNSDDIVDTLINCEVVP